MKKLRLKATELGAFEILTRDQLRNEIAGGSSSDSLSLSGGSSLSGGGCGHNIGCGSLGDPCGSRGICYCMYAPLGGQTMYCKHQMG